MARGIIDTVKLAATLVFALPVAAFGLDRVIGGDPVGFVFIGIGALMVIVEEYITQPSDLPTKAVKKATDTVVKDDE